MCWQKTILILSGRDAPPGIAWAWPLGWHFYGIPEGIGLRGSISRLQSWTGFLINFRYRLRYWQITGTVKPLGPNIETLPVARQSR